MTNFTPIFKSFILVKDIKMELNLKSQFNKSLLSKTMEGILFKFIVFNLGVLVWVCVLLPAQNINYTSLNYISQYSTNIIIMFVSE